MLPSVCFGLCRCPFEWGFVELSLYSVDDDEVNDMAVCDAFVKIVGRLV